MMVPGKGSKGSKDGGAWSDDEHRSAGRGRMGANAASWSAYDRPSVERVIRAPPLISLS